MHGSTMKKYVSFLLILFAAVFISCGGTGRHAAGGESLAPKSLLTFETGSRFTGGVVRDGHVYRRSTDACVIEVNAQTHAAGYVRCP